MKKKKKNVIKQLRQVKELDRMQILIRRVQSGPLNFPMEKKVFFFFHEKDLGYIFQKLFSCFPILFFCIVTSRKWFLARPTVWTAIESVNFTDFVQRAATAII